MHAVVSCWFRSCDDVLGEMTSRCCVCQNDPSIAQVGWPMMVGCGDQRLCQKAKLALTGDIAAGPECAVEAAVWAR